MKEIEKNLIKLTEKAKLLHQLFGLIFIFTGNELQYFFLITVNGTNKWFKHYCWRGIKTEGFSVCRSCIIASPETCTKWAVAASWKWCILGTTQWGFGPPHWLGTDPGQSPLTSMSRTPVSTTLSCCILMPSLTFDLFSSNVSRSQATLSTSWRSSSVQSSALCCCCSLLLGDLSCSRRSNFNFHTSFSVSENVMIILF